MTRESNARVWSKRLRSFEASGLSHRAWCERHGVSKSSLSYWRRRLANATPTLVPIVVAGESTTAVADGTLEIEVGGMRLRASAGVDAAWLCTVLQGLR